MAKLTMMIRNRRLYILCVAVFVLISCQRNRNEGKHLYAGNNHTLIGDSIFQNEMLVKIAFIDSDFDIDSISYLWYANKKLKSKSIYKSGLPVFERLQYYDNGNIEKYEFIDKQSRYSYERDYNEKGQLIKIKGKPFFSCVLSGMGDSLSVPRDSMLLAYLYAPVPPNVETSVYTLFEDDSSIVYFDRRPYLNCLFRQGQRAAGSGFVQWNIYMKFHDKETDTIILIKSPLFYKVVD